MTAPASPAAAVVLDFAMGFGGGMRPPGTGGFGGGVIGFTAGFIPGIGAAGLAVVAGVAAVCACTGGTGGAACAGVLGAGAA